MPNPQGSQGNSLGLAVGATNLAGAGDGQRPVIRASAVTLERGLTLTGFVDRVGDPVPMVAPDGSRHRPETLLVEALDEVARTAARTPVSDVAVTVPAHWRPSMVDALRGALRGKAGLARSPLVSDAAAALTALRSSPGLPTAGVIVLCDFGGSGTSITVVDAAANDAPIGETVRVPDFSGDQIDAAILTGVVAGVFDSSGADPAGTAMVGSLAVLRDECRRAKERLSDETATAIVVDVPGMETTVRMTRMELDELVSATLDPFLAVLAECLERNRIPMASISAVATVGGGARIPLITARLSQYLRATVVTTPQPQLTAAAGAALIAVRSQIVETATAMAPAAPVTATVAAAAYNGGAPAAVGGALAWSEVDDDAFDVLHTEPYFEDHHASTPADSRPEVHFQHEEWDDQPQARRRAPALLVGLAGAAVLVAAVVFGMTALSRDTSTVPAGSSSGIAPAPAAEQQAPAADAPAVGAPAPAQAQAPGVPTVIARPQPRYAPSPQPQQAPVVQQAPAQAPAVEAPAPAPEAPAPAPSAPAPEPAPSTPAPAPANPPPPTESGSGTPPADSGTGGSTSGGSSGTGGSTTGGTGTGTGGTGTGGGSETGTSTGAGTGAGTSSGAGSEQKPPAKPGPLAPILEPILTPLS